MDRFKRILALAETLVISRRPGQGSRAKGGLRQARRIVQIDPQSSYANAMAGFTYLLVDGVDEAVEL